LRTRGLTWLAFAALIATAAMAACAPPAGAVSKSCGSAQVKKPSGRHWVCTFGDNFNGASLNGRNWDVMKTAQTGFTQAGECYLDDSSNVSVGNGHLTLTATRRPVPQLCGLIASPYASGMIFTRDRFAQTYGRFKVRAKVPQGSGFASGFWLWPQNRSYGNRSGEIDIAESFGAPNVVSAHTHIRNGIGDLGQGAYCNVADSAGTFHTYTLVWLPSELKFKYDRRTCMDLTSWDPPAPLVFPQPFDRPFYVNLQLALGFGSNAVSLRSPFPARYLVDYVRVWR
jgi:beta-glucanase (GH16 family)